MQTGHLTKEGRRIKLATMKTIVSAALVAVALAGWAADTVSQQNEAQLLEATTNLARTTMKLKSATAVAPTPYVPKQNFTPTSKNAVMTNGFTQVMLNGQRITWEQTGKPVPAGIAESMDRRFGYLWRSNYPGPIQSLSGLTVIH